MILRVAILSAAALVFAPRPAAACSCAQRPPNVAFWEVDRVFTGRAEVIRFGKAAQRARFRIEESFRGPGGVIEIDATGIGGSCAYAFQDGIRYLVFARRVQDGTWRANFCDPTAPLNEARDVLDYARRMAGRSKP